MEDNIVISVELGSNIMINIEVNELNFDNVKQIQERISKLALEHNKNITINMGTVNFIDSAGISMLVRLIQRYSGAKRKIEFTNITSEVRNTLKMVHLNRFFKVE